MNVIFPGHAFDGSPYLSSLIYRPIPKLCILDAVQPEDHDRQSWLRGHVCVHALGPRVMRASDAFYDTTPTQTKRVLLSNKKDLKLTVIVIVPSESLGTELHVQEDGSAKNGHSTYDRDTDNQRRVVRAVAPRSVASA